MLRVSFSGVSDDRFEAVLTRLRREIRKKESRDDADYAFRGSLEGDQFTPLCCPGGLTAS